MTDEVPQEQRQGVLYERMLLFYAVSLTALGGLATTHLVRWRQALADAADSAAAASPLAVGPRRLARLRML